jgi:hypothetical protein
VTPSKKLIEAITVALEITNTQLSDPAIEFMLADLCRYPELQVLGALTRCCRELKPRQFTLEAVLSRIEDGRPTTEEAWGLVPKDESVSAVWTTEMREAWGAAHPQLRDGDLIAARMAFKEKYPTLVQRARDARLPVQWEVSLGHDLIGRELVLLDAAEKGRLSPQKVRSLLPYHRDNEGLHARLLALEGRSAAALLPAPSEKMKKLVSDLRAKLMAPPSAVDKAA